VLGDDDPGGGDLEDLTHLFVDQLRARKIGVRLS
jgi:hypothetical protein